MTVRFRVSDAWAALRAACEASKQPSHVAVAYLGQGGAQILPIIAGSVLVVDASDQAVKSGQTDPNELRKLVRRGVLVYSVSNLHAKVFVVGKRLFVGSTNISRRSQGILMEALVETSDTRAVTEAKRFIKGLCLNELGPEAIDRLTKIYRPPRVTGGPVRRSSRDVHAAQAGLPPVRLAQLEERDPPAGSELAEEHGRKSARRKMAQPRTHELNTFWWSGRCPFERGDIVVQVLAQDNGVVMVSPPGNVVDLETWRGRQQAVTFLYVEVPKRRRIELGRLAKRLGRGSRVRLLRGGKVTQWFGRELLAAWNSV